MDDREENLLDEFECMADALSEEKEKALTEAQNLPDPTGKE